MRLFIRAASLILLCQSVWGQEAIRLKARTIQAGATHAVQAQPRSRYWLVQFDRQPGEDTRLELSRRGFRVLSYVPDSSLMVEAPGAPDLGGLGVVRAVDLEPPDKLSPLLAEETAGAYLVEFHSGVDPHLAQTIVRRHRFQIHGAEGLLPGHLLVTGNHQSLAALAAHEEVAYVLPAGPDMFTRRRVAGCPGAITEVGPLADYVLASTGWSKDAQGLVALQYIFNNLTAKLDSNVARSEVERALTEWTRYANIRFTPAFQSGGPRTIDILFGTGSHGDPYPFTSTTTLAHTFYPAPPNPEPIAGDMHFNDAETWGVGINIDLFSVALHEAGHALGLAHSDLPTAVMYPYYRLAAGLTADDIAAIRALYGAGGGAPPAPPDPSPTPTPQPTPTPTPGSDKIAPSVKIVSPGSTIGSTYAASVALSGTAADNIAVTKVTWTNSTGGFGVAEGTSNWSAAVPLLVGTNTITVRAYDAAGNSGWRSVTMVRH